ncbi:MAG: hypothetical protein Q9168_002264 [Polycauliona sp. 1 TL-2023]
MGTGAVLGGFSLAIQLAGSCLKGYDVITSILAASEDSRCLSFQFEIERARLRGFLQAAGLVAGPDENGPTRTLLTRTTILLDVLSEIKATLMRYTENEDCVDDRSQESPSGTRPSDWSEGYRSLSGKLLLGLGRAPESTRIFRSFTWSTFRKADSEKVLQRLSRYNDFLLELLDAQQLRNLQIQQQEVCLELVQMRSSLGEIQKLEEAAQASMGFHSRSGTWQHAIDEELENLAGFKRLYASLLNDGSTRTSDIRVPPSTVRFCPNATEQQDHPRILCKSDGEDERELWINWQPMDNRLDDPAPTSMSPTEELAMLLMAPKPEEFCIPTCVGYSILRDGEEKACPALIFRNPPSIDPHIRPVSLLSALQDNVKPNLTHRIALAHKIAQCLLYLHTVNWLHKSFRSSNILLFPSADGELDVRAPYVTGFDNSRRSRFDEGTTLVPRNGRMEVYRHPDTQLDGPMLPYRKTFDIYSLGLVLAEIALWEPMVLIMDLQDSVDRSHRATREVRERWLGSEPRLLDSVRAEVGEKYAGAVETCLKGRESFTIETRNTETSADTGMVIQRGFSAMVTSSPTGFNAPIALHGNNGQNVKLELIPSTEGGFRAKGLVGKIGSMMHVDAGHDLFVDARGSNGEDGARGGDGLSGAPGLHGKDATRDADALPGGNGGRGGDGGLGSSGGDGGHGGKIQILTSENNMHLVIALDWDVRAGKGGRAGEHGRPGPGGSAGRGGSGHVWQELTGYDCPCFPHGTRSVSAPVTQSRQELTASNLRALSQLHAGRDIAFSFPQGYLSDGTNVAQVCNIDGTIPAHIAAQFQRALRAPGCDEDFSQAIVPRGHSTANAQHASDCRQVPVYTSRYKTGASDGKTGPSGRAPATPLHPGQDGLDGTVGLLVRQDNGTVSTYDAIFEFQLLGFDVVDENGDGVFEPGECAIIRNIRIKNSGGMPTPKRTLIPVTMQPSTGLTPLRGKETVYLPLDMPVGDTNQIADEIWVEIKSNSTQPDSTAFKASSTIRLQAIVPDLNRKLPQFEASQTITIQYPVKFVTDEFKWMDTIPQGSSTSLQWAVMNISSKDLGINSPSQRTIMTQISCPPTAPVILGDTLSADSASDQSRRIQAIEFLRRDMSNPVSESLAVTEDTAEHSTIELLIELLLTPASVGPASNAPDPITVQTRRLSMQVSKTWQYNAKSEFLLLTSKSTTKDTITSWSHFIQKHLHKSVDVWNVSLYGGVEAETTYQSVLDSYVGKTVLALDDDLFSYFDRGQRGILDFIDPSEGALLSRKGTRIVSVHRKAKERHEREGKNMEHVAHAAALRSSPTDSNGRQECGNTNELMERLRSLGEDPSSSTPGQQFFVPFRGSGSRSKGREMAKKLTKEFPLDQFLVTDSSDGLGANIIHCGAHGQSYSRAEVAQMSNGVGRAEEFSGLNPAEAYACVAALPLRARLDLLLTSQRYSDFIQEAALGSVKAELHDQVQAMSKRPRWRDGLFPDLEAVSTKSLFDSTNDSITAVLNHEIMRHAGVCLDDPTSPAGQILRSIIQSARCQTTEQLLIKWFSPFKRTRSHVRRSLMGSVRDLIAADGPNKEPDPNAMLGRVKSFKKTVPQRLLNKNHQLGINNDVQAITHDAIKDVKQSLLTIDEVMPQSVYKSSTELSSNKSSYQRAELQRKRDRLQHRLWKKELGSGITSGAASVKTDDQAPVAAACSMHSSELASTSVYGRSVASSRSEASTILTLPEMDVVPATASVRRPSDLPPLKLRNNNEDRSPVPLSPLSPRSPTSDTTAAELPSNAASDHRTPATSSTVSPPIIAFPSPAAKRHSSLSIKKTRKRPPADIHHISSSRPQSPESVPASASPPSNPPDHGTPVSTRGPDSRGFSLPELFEEDQPWEAASEKAYEPPDTPLERQELPSPSQPYPARECVTDVPTPPDEKKAASIDMSKGPVGLDDALFHGKTDVEPALTREPKGLDGGDDDDDAADGLPVWSDYDEDDLKIDWSL